MLSLAWQALSVHAMFRLIQCSVLLGMFTIMELLHFQFLIHPRFKSSNTSASPLGMNVSLCPNVSTMSFDKYLTEISPISRRQLKLNIVSWVFMVWLKITNNCFLGIICTHGLCLIRQMYKVNKVNFVSMLTLNHNSESSEFPRSRRILQFEKAKFHGTQLVLMLTHRCVYSGGRVKGIGVSVFVTDRQNCASKTHY